MYAVLKAASCCTPNSSEANSHGWIVRGKFGKEKGMVTSVNKDSSSVVLRRFEHFSFLGTVDIFILFGATAECYSNRPISTHSTDTEQVQSNDVDKR